MTIECDLPVFAVCNEFLGCLFSMLGGQRIIHSSRELMFSVACLLSALVWSGVYLCGPTMNSPFGIPDSGNLANRTCFSGRWRQLLTFRALEWYPPFMLIVTRIINKQGMWTLTHGSLRSRASSETTRSIISEGCMHEDGIAIPLSKTGMYELKAKGAEGCT